MALLAALPATVALAAQEDWIELPAAAPHVRFAVDRNSIEREGDLARFRERVIYSPPVLRDAASGKWVGEKRVQRLMDCEKRTQAVVSGSVRANDGSFITSTTFERPEAAMTPIPPGSIAEAEFRLVCAPPRGTLFGIGY